MRKHAITLLAMGCALLLTMACSMEDYDSGDGKNSYLRADFVEARSG